MAEGLLEILLLPDRLGHADKLRLPVGFFGLDLAHEVDQRQDAEVDDREHEEHDGADQDDFPVPFRQFHFCSSSWISKRKCSAPSLVFVMDPCRLRDLKNRIALKRVCRSRTESVYPLITRLSPRTYSLR